MPAAARTTDLVSTGHGCDGTTTADTHASHVYIEGLLAHREEDLTSSHTLPSGDSCVSHTVALDPIESPNVFVEGKALGRVGDTYGSHVITGGASHVFVNDPYTPSSTSKPLMTKMVNNEYDIIEMIATLLFGKIAHADPIDHLTEEQFNSIFIENDKKKYLSVEEYNKHIDELSKGLDKTAEAVHIFRGQQGYSAEGKPTTHKSFMYQFGEDIKMYGKLKTEIDVMKSSVTKLVKDENGKEFLRTVWSDDPDLFKSYNQKRIRVEILEAELVDNASHKNLADILWKNSSITIDRPVIIKRTHRLYEYGGFQDPIDSKPPKPMSTYSATVVDVDDIEYTSILDGGKKGVKQFWLLPAGTRVIHTVGLADNHEILVSGRDLLNTKLLYSGSMLQDMKLALDRDGGINDEMWEIMQEEFEERNPGKPIPPWWIKLKHDWPQIKAGLDAKQSKNWRLNVLLMAVTGTAAWYADSDEYWDIYKSKNMYDIQDKLTKYYGHSTDDITRAADFHDRLNQIALATLVQAADILVTLPFATAGGGMKKLWEQQERGWLWLMENISELEDDLEELLTPPDGWD